MAAASSEWGDCIASDLLGFILHVYVCMYMCLPRNAPIFPNWSASSHTWRMLLLIVLQNRTLLIYLFTDPIHSCLFSLFFSFSFFVLRRTSDPGSPSRLLSALPELQCVPSCLSRECLSPFFPRRLASNCAYPRCSPLSAVDSIIFFVFFSITQKLSTHTKDSDPRPYSINSSNR